MFRLIYGLFALAIVVIGVLFYLRNDRSVLIDYMIGSDNVNLPVLLLGTLTLGILLGALACLPVVFRLKKANKGLHKRNDLATREIANLRALPLRDAS